MKNVAFCTCSYVQNASSFRARMIQKAFRSWREFLQLPFQEKIFLDDRSPHFGALKVLEASSVLALFDRVQYQTLAHAAHSNFGIVACMELTSAPYILHLDDDIFIKHEASRCKSYIEELMSILDHDSSIMGANIITMNSTLHGEEWLPGRPYNGSEVWHHPNKLFGTGACLIRRELLQRLPFSRILQFGGNQPANWEVLVTHAPEEFLTYSPETPFSSWDSAFFYSSTKENSVGDRFRFHYPRLARLIGRGKKILGMRTSIIK